AKSYMLTGERERGAAMFKKAEALAPKDASIPFERGACLARAKDFDEAIESMSKAVKLEPGNRQYSKYLGLTLARAGRYDDGGAGEGHAGGRGPLHPRPDARAQPDGRRRRAATAAGRAGRPELPAGRADALRPGPRRRSRHPHRRPRGAGPGRGGAAGASRRS